MVVDIRQIAEQLIVKLWGESDALRHQADGVRLFLHTIIKESEKANEQSSDTGTTAPEEKQAE
jgi:hypothetical protein